MDRWCARCAAAAGGDGLRDRPRCGAPSLFPLGQRCAVIAIACDTPVHHRYPEGTVWTLQRLTQSVRARVEDPPMG